MSHEKRMKYHTTKRANEELRAFLVKSTKGMPTPRVIKSCREATNKMKDMLFSAGTVDRVLRMLWYFCKRPAVLELGAAKEMMSEVDSASYYTKEERLNSVVLRNLEGFLDMFRCRHKDGDC